MGRVPKRTAYDYMVRAITPTAAHALQLVFTRLSAWGAAQEPPVLIDVEALFSTIETLRRT